MHHIVVSSHNSLGTSLREKHMTWCKQLEYLVFLFSWFTTIFTDLRLSYYYCHGNCVNLVWMLYLGMRGTSVLNIDCYWLNERVCVNCPLVRAVTDTSHLSVSWMMCWLQLDTWAQDAVWCGPLVTELPALKSLKRIPELWIIHTSNTRHSS